MNKKTAPRRRAAANIAPNYVGGEWRLGKGGSIRNINPADPAQVIGVFSAADRALIHRAAQGAHDASARWGSAGLEERCAALSKIGDALRAKAATMGEIIARESGKPIGEAMAEASRAGQFFQYYAAEVFRLMGESADSVRPGIEAETRREPVGAVAVISPWNFPLATASWKIAPAIAFGNAVVWKPSPLTPAAANALAHIAADAGLPAGVFNVIHGGDAVGRALTNHLSIAAVTFTGSSKAGAQVARACAGRLAKCQLEMSGKNALAVMDDADINAAAQAALVGAYSFAGQKCTASGRLIVHRKIHDEFVGKLEKLLRAQVVGDPLDKKTTMGPVISAAKLRENLSYIALAKKEGCRLVCGGEKIAAGKKGYFMNPALFVSAKNTMRVCREEMFAPIACVIAAGDYEEALSLVNDSDYGLAAGIFTRSLARAAHFRRNAAAGCVMINLPTAGTDYHLPFGGRKKSGYGGREQGRYAAEFYTEVKTVYRNCGRP